MNIQLGRAAAWTLGLAAAAAAEAAPIDVVLRLQEKIPMAVLADDVTDPASLRYQRYYTPGEIRRIAGPSAREYRALLRHLRREGLRVVSESPTHLMLTVRGELDVFERHFGVRIETLTASSRRLRGRVTVPDAMRLVSGVSGLDTRRRARAHWRRRPAELSPAALGVSLAQIRALYGFDALYAQGLTGQGQDIAIATYDDFALSDVTDYYAKNGVTPGPTVDKVEFNGAPPTNANSAVETEVDAEFSGALAPGAAIHVYSSATNDDAGEEQMFTAILDDDRVKIVNYSWGGCESDLTDAHKAAMDALFQRAVAQGVNILNASGDSGSACTGADGVSHDPLPDWPAAHPAVVAVGGTTLDLTAAGLAESAWSGGGGGVSAVWALPAYQAGLGAPYLKRSYPDVAFNADPASGQAAWVDDKGTGAEYLVIGGTSIAAPQWAGLLALVGEARAAAGLAPVGFLNPRLYALSADDRAASFDDVGAGSNGAYSAAAGWDAVTGWGGPQAPGLLQALTRD